MTKIVHARVYEQIPHPMLGPASFVVVKFDDPAFIFMNHRRIKREHNRVVKKWRAGQKGPTEMMYWFNISGETAAGNVFDASFAAPTAGGGQGAVPSGSILAGRSIEMSPADDRPVVH